MLIVLNQATNFAPTIMGLYISFLNFKALTTSKHHLSHTIISRLAGYYCKGKLSCPCDIRWCSPGHPSPTPFPPGLIYSPSSSWWQSMKMPFQRIAHVPGILLWNRTHVGYHFDRWLGHGEAWILYSPNFAVNELGNPGWVSSPVEAPVSTSVK